MFGGNDQDVINKMSLVLEMIHAYLLITDDISDRSELRRGGPTAHRILEDWFTRTNQIGDRQHFGGQPGHASRHDGHAPGHERTQPDSGRRRAPSRSQRQPQS
jgi:hypothetical protein